MTFEEWIKAGYKFFGPEAMQVMNQFFSGKIDWNTAMDLVQDPFWKYRISEFMWDEIEKTNPKMVKITSKFASYLDTQNVEWMEILDELPKGVTTGRFDSIPIEIDDSITNEYYELVY